MTEHCPCCLRPFDKMQDYPLILVSKVERLPLPEFMDLFSAEAAELQLRLSREERQDPDRLMSTGINRTPEIAAAYELQEVQDYLEMLESFQGVETSPDKLLPTLEPGGHFRWAYPIPGSKLFLSLTEGEAQEDERICQVVFHGEGPNLGSLGGPTLQPYGAIANIHYEGRLMLTGQQQNAG